MTAQNTIIELRDATNRVIELYFQRMKHPSEVDEPNITSDEVAQMVAMIETLDSVNDRQKKI